MLINKGSINNYTIAKDRNDDLRILESLRDTLEEARDKVNWIIAPTKEDMEALNKLIEDFNLKITDLLGKQ